MRRFFEGLAEGFTRAFAIKRPAQETDMTKLKDIAAKDVWSPEEFRRMHEYNTGVRWPTSEEIDANAIDPEVSMTMEKRGVVANEHEKKAQERVKKEAPRGVRSGRMPSDKTNQANTPKNGDK